MKIKEQELDDMLQKDREKFKLLINSMDEKEQIAYLDTLVFNKEFVISSIDNITENIIKNEIRKNPLNILKFQGRDIPKEIVESVYSTLKGSLLGSSIYKNAFKRAMEFCKKELEK
jgi:hypothetical protein